MSIDIDSSVPKVSAEIPDFWVGFLSGKKMFRDINGLGVHVKCCVVLAQAHALY